MRLPQSRQVPTQGTCLGCSILFLKNSNYASIVQERFLGWAGPEVANDERCLAHFKRPRIESLDAGMLCLFPFRSFVYTFMMVPVFEGLATPTDWQAPLPLQHACFTNGWVKG